MNVSLSRIIRTVATAAIAVIAVVIAYQLGKRQSFSTDDETIAELEELRSSQSDAAIVKRVSQQMEDIAYQQKAVSDQQRDRAEQQSELALAMRDRAEQESRLARQAEKRANTAAQEAQEQREAAMAHQKMAEDQRDQANYAKSVTDTLSYRTLGRTLGSSSITQFEGGNAGLAAKLAYNSWYMLDTYAGNTYYAETYSALENCSETSASVSTRKGGGVRSMIPYHNDECVAVTDYGEMEMISKGMKRSVVLQNGNYDFRDVWTDGKEIYALSYHGPLCITDRKGNVREVQLPAGDYLKIIEDGMGNLLIAAKRHVLSYGLVSGKQEIVMDFDNDLLAMTDCTGRALFFFADGTAQERLDDGYIQKSFINEGRPVTVAFFDRELEALFLGCDNGEVLIFDDEENYLATVYGHNSRVTDILVVNDILVTSSYDKNVYLWNLPFFRMSETQSLAHVLGIIRTDETQQKHSVSQEWLNPVPLKLDSWPFSICRFGKNEIAVGTSDGHIISYNVSTSDMAARIREKYDVTLNSQEWDHYVGGKFPYISFE